MAYTTVDRVRNVSGLTESEADDLKVEELIAYADSIVETVTGKTWSSSEPEFPQIQLASSLLVAWLCYRGLVGAEDKAERCRREALAILEALRSGALLRV